MTTDWTKARELCERAPADIEMVDTNDHHYGYGSATHEPSKESREFYEEARRLLPEAIEAIDAIQGIEARAGYEAMRKDEARADLDIANARLARLEAIAREAITIGIRLAGLECSSADEERLAALLEEVDRG